MGHSLCSFVRVECLVKGVDEYDDELTVNDVSDELWSDLWGDALGGEMGSCFTSPRKFSSISHASSLSFPSFWEFIVAPIPILSFVSESLLFSDLRLLLGRGYPELVVQAVEDELVGDSLSEVRWPELECLS